MKDLSDDWRLLNQLQYLYHARLVLRPYAVRRQWQQDQCEFCSKKFSEVVSEGTMQSGYTTSDDDQWVCMKCYGDFGEWFDWGV
jgi:hypothetical protein